MNISERIFDLLEKQNKTASDLGKYLQVSSASINGWKNGSFPSSKHVEKIAQFFDVSLDFLLTGKESSGKIIHLYGKEETTRKEIRELLQIIEQLDEENMHTLRKYLKFLTYEQNGYPTQIRETSPEYPYFTCAESAREHSSTYSRSSESGDDWKNIRIVGLSAAGEPIELPEDPYSFTDLVSVPLASKADFAVKIKGDSMDPDIPDGSIVLVRKQPEVETGEIAIVSLDHAATCKKFYRYEDRIELVSINKNYKPIVIREEDNIDIRIIGKVLQ